ncbi:hypothetical protein RJP21_01465 [Paenibacillus sp. VCA1]|uniref:hypothetical protein n=1 Tax=Paenibacillus sp. VCA1 TaxID=3039148 RepID=UPI0028710954|nr:hypothetical protein [Paenibacillus sp. VCA1]MDR9852264.1 hypothetical protein [Paenibacillus sp. VCA1]
MFHFAAPNIMPDPTKKKQLRFCPFEAIFAQAAFVVRVFAWQKEAALWLGAALLHKTGDLFLFP